jgi:uncharacterized membrane protein YfcA
VLDPTLATVPTADGLAYVLMAIVLLAFTVEATLGFGATIVTVALGALVADVTTVLPAFVPLNVAMSAYLFARYARLSRFDLLLKLILPAMALGMPLGMLAFAHLDVVVLQKIFGAFVIVLACLELYRARARALTKDPGPDPILSTPVELGFLGLGGIVHGAFGTGGPMVVYVLGRRVTDKGEFRATLSLLWLVLNITLVVGYALNDKLTSSSLTTTLILAPALIVGLLLGERLHHKVPAGLFRNAVYIMLLAAGLLIVLR